MRKSKNIQDKWLIILIALLGLYLVFKIIERSNLISVFPFDFINDISSYMARLFFLAKYGFHAMVPNWFNGDYISFLFTPPAWYYFALPFYYLTKSVEIAAYTTFILTYILGLISFLILGKLNRLSLPKTIAFYLLFFANPLAIGNFIRLGKFPEMFSWTAFIGLFILIFFYFGKKFDMKAILLIPLYALVLLSSPSVFIFASILIFSLFLIKPFKEKILITFFVILTALITSFWWIPYISNASGYYAGERVEMQGFLFDPLYVLGDTLASFAIMPIFFLALYFYLKSKRFAKKETLFFLPSLILGFLFFTRLIVFIPFLNKPHPDSYSIFFFFLSILLLFKTDFSIFPKTLKRIIKFSLMLIPVLIIAVSEMTMAPYVGHTVKDSETIELMSLVGNSGNLVILGASSYNPSYYAYGSIYYDIRTSGGYSIEEMKTELIKKSEGMQQGFEDQECSFIDKADKLGIDYIITYDKQCDFLKSCGLKEARKMSETCLYNI